MISFDDLTRPLTRSEVQAKIYEIVGLVGTDTSSWKAGAVVRTMIAATSIILAAFSVLISQIARSGFLELAEGPWLTLVARHVYKVERETATYAEGEIALANSGGGVYPLDVGDLIVANPTTGKQYRNSAAVTIGALESGVLVPIVAVEEGAASTSAPDTITELITPLIGVSGTNHQPVVGLDAEEDPALRARCSAKLGSLSPFGPWDAYTYAARTATRADGSRIGVTRVRTTKDGYGNVHVYAATASGAVTGSVAAPTSDLGMLDEAIQRRAVPIPAVAHVHAAAEKVIAVSYRVTMYNTSGLTEQQIKDLIAARLVTFMAGQPVGGNVTGTPTGKLYVDAIRTAIGATLPQIFHVEVTAPAADVTIAASEVPVLGAVTPILIAQVSPSDGAAV